MSHEISLKSRDFKNVPGGKYAMAAVGFVIGLGCLGMSIPGLLTYQRSATWTKVPAQIEEVDIKYRQTKKGRSESYLVCKYTYSVDSKPYTGTRVAIDEPGGSRRDNIYKDLKEAKSLGKPWDALVDPKDPSQAMLSRALPVMSVGLLVFGCALLLFGVGGAIVWVITSGKQKAAQAQVDAAFAKFNKRD